MTTQTVGEILRAKRGHYQMSLESFSQRSHIKLEYLEALEEDRYVDLPAATFVKGYIKTYAQTFDFDEQPLYGILRRDYQESTKGMLVPREYSRPAMKKRLRWSPINWVVLGAGAVFLVLISYVGLQWFNLNKPPVLKIYSPQDQASVAQTVEVTGQTEPSARLVVNELPVALKPDGTFTTTVFFPSTGIGIVSVKATNQRGKEATVQTRVYVEE